MQQETHEQQSSTRTSGLSLDALSRMSVRELTQLYKGGVCPDTIDDISGLPRGRMLAVRGLDDGIASSVLRRIAGSSAFPWGGKTFEGQGRGGHGINRVHLGGRHALFPFLLRRETSVIDGEPCVMLDYDLDDNPWAIRHILDEVREVAPRLLLGPALWKTKAKPVLVLWFALDLSQTARSIGGVREALS
jgi:hypothetical protein